MSTTKDVNIENLSIIQQCGLFNSIGIDHLIYLCEKSKIEKHMSGATVFKEGDLGDTFYIIIEGSAQIYVEKLDEGPIVLAKLESGKYFGEQSLLPGGSTKRNASVKAYSDISLLSVPASVFQKILKENDDIKHELMSLGEQQLQQRMINQSKLFSILVRNEGSQVKPIIRKYNKKEIIFSEGDESDGMFLIKSGHASIYKQSSGYQLLVCHLYAGNCFGEQGLIHDKARACTLIADTELETVFIEKNRFLKLLKQHPQLRDYFTTLLKIYQLPQKGFITQNTTRNNLGHDLIETFYELVDGMKYLCQLNMDTKSYHIQRITDATEALTAYNYRLPETNIKRELKVNEAGLICEIIAEGDWQELPDVHQAIMDKATINATQLKQFSEKGFFTPSKAAEPEQGDKIVCKCMQISADKINRAIADGVDTFEGLQTQMSCATVCGGCKPDILEMIGESAWSQVKLTTIIPVLNNVHSYRFKPISGHCYPLKPGQHIIIRTSINGNLIQRPYTLTSDNTHSYYEITVKCEKKGVFSRWLFENAKEGMLFEMSKPQGDYFWQPANKSVVCLSGGIGITPALAISRYILHNSCSNHLFVDYSVLDENHVVMAKELKSDAECPNMDINIRNTSKDGVLSQEKLERITENYPEADYFICGPMKYNEVMQDYLKAAGIDEHSIHVEKFIHQGDPSPTEATCPMKGNEAGPSQLETSGIMRFLKGDDIKKAKLPPMGDGSIPLLGHVRQFNNRLVEYLTSQSIKNKPLIRLKILGLKFTCLTGTNANKLLLEHPELLDHEKTFRIFNKAYQIKRHVITTGGETHRCLRKASDPAGSNSAIDAKLQHVIPIIDEFAARLKIKDRLSCDNLNILIQKIIFFLLASYNMSSDEVLTMSKFYYSMKIPTTILFPKMYQVNSPRSLFHRKRLFKLANHIIKRHQMLKTNLRSPDIIDMMLSARNENNEPYSQGDIRGVLMYILGVEDTLTPSTEFMLFKILQDPELKQEIDKEIDTLFSNDKLTLQHIERSLLLSSTAKELLRYHPTVGSVIGLNKKEFEFENFRIQKGTYMIVGQTVTHFLPEYFENPHQFNPRRFLNGFVPEPFTYNPFGVGPHICPGRYIANALLPLVTARLLYLFDFKLLSHDFKLAPSMMYKLANRPVQITKQRW